MHSILRPLLVLIVCAAAGLAQTTQGLISGKLINSITGKPIAVANVEYWSATGNLAGTAASDASGYYYLPLLSPGFYRIRVSAPAYQSQEVQEIELTVAARIELDFPLRPLNDVWESGAYRSVFLPGAKTIVTFFGPDVDPSKSGSFEAQKGRRAALESTVSEVVDSGEINNLPLSGRDVYTMLVTQPGVTSDAATGRGLGLAINGQRPSASNYLLDGVENNNYLITGPLTVVAPEAIQEYRVSTNNFSAEYGRTSGFLANAITRSGGDRFHGVAYFYIKNEALNANGFQENANGAPRTPAKQANPGFVVEGPVLRNRLYFSSAFDYLRSRSQQDPQQFNLPTASFIVFASANPLVNRLLTQFPFPMPVTQSANQFSAPVTIAPPVSVDRKLAVERLDYNTPSGKDRLMARVLINRLARPDFIWTPYPDFVSALHEYTWALGVSHIRTLRSNLLNEARLSYSVDNLHWNRPHPEIPTLVTIDPNLPATEISNAVTLPGSPAFYEYKNVNRSWELVDNLIWTHGKHLVTTGAGLLLRSSDGYLTAGRDGEYLFDNMVSFALDTPSSFRTSIERTVLPAVQQPDFNRTYQYRQYFLFAQDTYKLTSRLTVNYGVRYEYYGGPRNTGAAKDTLVHLGSGSNLAQQIAGATLVKPTQPGDQLLFGSDKTDFAFRVGASYDLLGTGRTVLRGGYGTFFDRPFDNLWENLRNNSFILPLLTPPSAPLNYLSPIRSVLTGIQGQSLTGNFPDVTLVDPGLKNGYAHSYFAGVQQRVSDNFTLEVNGLGTYGRRLITTDVVNRDFTLTTGRINPNLPDIAYRAAQGFSDYNALTAVARYRASRGMVQASYTWSHMIDNQSDALTGDFFNLNFTSLQSSADSNGRATFSRQFDPQADRGNSDFDQRHDLVVFSYWNLPAAFANSKAGFLFRGWMVSELAAFRSGFPFTVGGTSQATNGLGQIMNNRPDIVDPRQTVFSSPIAVKGGEQLLNPAGFAEAAVSTLGNEGRNAFRGPGFYNLDVSLARSVGLRWLGEGGSLTFRADAFNLLNHSNLGNPDSGLTDPLSSTFGVATFGRQGRQSGFPAVSPLNETGRQIQLSVKLSF
jgi:hypothetical protein